MAEKIFEGQLYSVQFLKAFRYHRDPSLRAHL
jgi:hypothetical protein